ncbi:hypothetical protein [Arthrobacter oryzae]|uniref:hypothetical protein n=1 Tax=Arthrobacter oryzae TaxID=409290 RepID=UPI0027891422|nr:hypothetical protein [Arthrobacter oryzae]MDQ0078224.1 hypothetical protein [Arthrobacter oryzae]
MEKLMPYYAWQTEVFADSFDDWVEVLGIACMEDEVDMHSVVTRVAQLASQDIEGRGFGWKNMENFYISAVSDDKYDLY